MLVWPTPCSISLKVVEFHVIVHWYLDEYGIFSLSYYLSIHMELRSQHIKCVIVLGAKYMLKWPLMMFKASCVHACVRMFEQVNMTLFRTHRFLCMSDMRGAFLSIHRRILLCVSVHLCLYVCVPGWDYDRDRWGRAGLARDWCAFASVTSDLGEAGSGGHPLPPCIS